MLVKEIHEALDEKDLNRVWELMFERTAWIQNNTFSQEEAARHAKDTVEIRNRLLMIQQATKEEMTRVMRTRHATRAYGSWRKQG